MNNHENNKLNSVGVKISKLFIGNLIYWFFTFLKEFRFVVLSFRIYGFHFQNFKLIFYLINLR